MSSIFLEKGSGAAADLLRASGIDFIAGGVCPDDIGCVIIDSENDIDETVGAAMVHVRAGRDVCVTARTLTDKLSDAMKTSGIARFLDYKTLGTFIPVAASSEKKSGNVLLIDDCDAHFTMTRSICGLFGFGIIVEAEIESAINAISDGPPIIIHNLSLQSIDLIAFVKRTSRSALASVPYIAFKNKGDAVSMHELHCGIGRITKVILSRDEMLSVLSYNLFMKEFYERFRLLETSVSGNPRGVFSENNLKRVYFTHKNSFFEDRMRSTVSSLFNAAPMIDLTRETLAKCASLEWLFLNNDRPSLDGNGF
jgi:hypothetical protein